MSENVYYVSDNLEVMRGMRDESVDLIYADPPFNTGRDFGAFKDKDFDTVPIHQPKLRPLLDTLYSIGGEGLWRYCVFMAVRIIEFQRLLFRNGSLYLHCDPHTSPYLRLILDVVFGANNYKNEIVWWYKGTGRPLRKFPSKHDIILFYTKTKESTFNPIRVPGAKKSAWTGRTDKLLDSVWEIHTVFQKERSTRTGYPTQKPLNLLERIIKASSNEGDTVLDPFAGSGTTLVAAESLGRKWIGIDSNPQAKEVFEGRRVHDNSEKPTND